MKPDYAVAGSKIGEIEAEMKRIGLWQLQPPPPDRLKFTQPFGGDKLSFEQWLQFIFIVRVKGIIQAKGTFPSQSQVHTQAYREWKMWGQTENVDTLLELLAAFDALFTGD